MARPLATVLAVTLIASSSMMGCHRIRDRHASEHTSGDEKAIVIGDDDREHDEHHHERSSEHEHEHDRDRDHDHATTTTTTVHSD